MNSQLVNRTKTVIDEIISLIYKINELPFRYRGEGDSYSGLGIVLEFAGFSRDNQFEVINGNTIGSLAAAKLRSLGRSLDLKALEDYRDALQEQVDTFNVAQQIVAEAKRKEEEEQIRQQEEEDYLHQHGMFGNLDY